MSALNGLHNMLESESLKRDFIDFQLEQMVNRDIRDLNLAMEGEDADLPDDDDMNVEDDKKDTEEGCAKECGDGSCEDADDFDDDDDDFDGYDDDPDDSDYGNSDLTGHANPIEDDDFDDLEESLDLDLESLEVEGPEITNESYTGMESVLGLIPEATPAEVAQFHRTLEAGGVEAINATLEEETCANLLLG